MNRLDAARNAPRCTARSKRTGVRCRAPAVRGWCICRFHGAGGGGPKGAANGNWKSGYFAAEAVETRREVAEIIRGARRAARMVSV